MHGILHRHPSSQMRHEIRISMTEVFLFKWQQAASQAICAAAVFRGNMWATGSKCMYKSVFLTPCNAVTLTLKMMLLVQAAPVMDTISALWFFLLPASCHFPRSARVSPHYNHITHSTSSGNVIALLAVYLALSCLPRTRFTDTSVLVAFAQAYSRIAVF